MNKNKKHAIIIILVTNAIIISLLESLIPIPIPVPGVKLGLANIITLIGLVFLPVTDVLIMVLIRCFVVALLTRGILMLAFSISGGILSALVMALLFKKLSGIFSTKGISIVGAFIHNITQLTIASFLLGEIVILYYLPILLVSAGITGFITGSIGEIVIKEIKEKGIFSDKSNVRFHDSQINDIEK